jgi:mRNA-degrading endonuclease RelE of RelBE toxin-antitoxin system
MAVRKLSKGQASSIDVKRLQGDLHDSFRVRLGNIQIVFSVQYGLVHVASVSEIGFRGGVY